MLAACQKINTAFGIWKGNFLLHGENISDSRKHCCLLTSPAQDKAKTQKDAWQKQSMTSTKKKALSWCQAVLRAAISPPGIKCGRQRSRLRVLGFNARCKWKMSFLRENRLMSGCKAQLVWDYRSIMEIVVTSAAYLNIVT